MELAPTDWGEVFAFETPLLELLARGSGLYLGILVLMRFMPRRTGGELGRMDLVFILLIANAGANAMGAYRSVSDGLALIVVLMGWNWATNFLSYRVPWIERLVSAPPLEVIRDGRLLRRNLRHEFLTEEELLARLHEAGVDSFDKVRSAYVEGDGKITIIKVSG